LQASGEQTFLHSALDVVLEEGISIQSGIAGR